MGVIRTGQSAHDKELATWDRPRNQVDEDGRAGMNAAGYEPFPKMLYKAHRRENGKVSCMDMDAIYAVDPVKQAQAEAFNRTCQLTVKDESEWRRAKDSGWCDSPADALEYHERLAQDVAKAAAEAAHSLRTMSHQAKREHAFLDANTDAPVVDVPAPKKKPGRPRKLAAV